MVCLSVGAIGLVAAASGCGADAGPHVIPVVRVSSAPGKTVRDVDSAARLGLRRPTAGRGHGGGMGGGMGTGAPRPSKLAWDTPDGWTALPASQFRVANFSAPGGVECYMTVLGGTGGGLVLNLNRWRGQLGLGDLSDAEVAALPTRKVLGVTAPFVEMEGTFQGEPSKLAGVLALTPDALVTVKMTGPAAAVNDALPQLEIFLFSLRRAGGAPGRAPAGPARPADAHAGHAELAWNDPAGWTVKPASQFRQANYEVPGGVECYMTILPGTGGGVAANLARWRGQLGLSGSGDPSQLPTRTVLGASALFVELEAGDHKLAGLIVELPGRMITIKMTGPSAAVDAALPGLEAFAGSLRVDEQHSH